MLAVCEWGCMIKKHNTCSSVCKCQYGLRKDLCVSYKSSPFTIDKSPDFNSNMKLIFRKLHALVLHLPYFVTSYMSEKTNWLVCTNYKLPFSQKKIQQNSIGVASMGLMQEP